MNPATILSDFLVYVLSAAVMVLAGLGLLSLFRVRTDTPTAIGLAPVVTQGIWANALGFGVACNIRVGTLALPIWLATLVLVLFGCWSSWPNREHGAGSRPTRNGSFHHVWVLFGCLLLPLATLLPYLLYGFSEYLGSRNPDGWSYIAYGEYLWSVPRGTEGGLPPVRQYASHLAHTRHVASSELALLSVFSVPGDTQSATGLFLALSFFSYASACAAFARTRDLSTRATLVFLAVAVLSGWSLNLLLASNYDNLVALTFIPGIVALASLPSAQGVGWWLIGAMVLAGAIYTYPELAGIVCALAFVMVVQRIWSSREPGWPAKVALSTLATLALLSPYIPALIAFVKVQVGLSLAVGVRPGEGYFPGLLAGWGFASAFWALGDELAVRNLRVVPTLFGSALFLILSLGIWRQLRKRDIGALAAISSTLPAALFLLVGQRYSYGGYKMIVMGWWVTAFLLVVGSSALGERSRLRQILSVASVLTCLAVPTVAVARITDEIVNTHPLRMDHYRSIRNLSRFVGEAPVGIFLEGWEASEWAVYFLRDQPIKVGDVAGYLNGPHIRQFVDRSTPISWNDIRYILTDANDPGPAIELHPWTLVWQRGAYRVWDTKGSRWALVTEASTPHGFEQVNGSLVFWLGGGPTQFRLFANSVGVMRIDMDISEGPNASRYDPISLKIDTTSGLHTTLELSPGSNHFQLVVPEGITDLTVTPIHAIRSVASDKNVPKGVAAVWKLVTSFE